MWIAVCLMGFVCAGLMGMMYAKGSADGRKRLEQTDPIDLIELERRCVRVCRRWLHSARRKVYHPELRYIRDTGFGVHRVSVVRMKQGDDTKHLVYIDLNGIKAASDVRLNSLEQEIGFELQTRMDIPMGSVIIRRVDDEPKCSHPVARWAKRPVDPVTRES